VGAYIVRRFIQMILLILVVVTLFFFLLRLTGDPAQILLAEDATQSQVDELRERLGLDRPLHVQYYRFLMSAVQLDVGDSYYYRQSALKLVIERLPASLQLLVGATLISIVISIPFGVVSAVYRGTWFDRSILAGSLIGISAPSFLVAILLILAFSVSLGWLPSSGRGTFSHFILPSVSLALLRVAIGIRFIRSGMLDVLSMEYVRTARAKGLSEPAVLIRHALRNTLIPFVTITGLQMGAVLSGAIVIERIYAWPGMGRLLLNSLERLDYPVIIAYGLVAAVIFSLINFIVDISYFALDPRVRL
jgi:peptide/nickel transport system permease protein